MIGILLAGGQARRLGGGDKGRSTIGGTTLLDRVISAMAPQCTALVLNANGDPDRFASSGLPIVADPIPGQPGPLAGILAGLDYVAAIDPHASHAVTVPTDSPFLPLDLVSRLDAVRAFGDASVVCARTAGRRHPTVALWRVALRHHVRHALDHEKLRAVSLFAERHACVYVDWEVGAYDPFFNVNTPEDLEAARRVATSLDGAS